MNDGSIAIVGASCRFPGAPSLEAFWDLLASGTDAISEVDAGRWSTRFYYHPTYGEPGKSYTWAAGLIPEVDLFEPAFFGISPREAAQMDPQQRILLELVWHATEDAGIPASKLAGSATGVYIGGSSTDYRDLRLGDPASGDSYFMTGATLSILANRISYVFDLHGPSLTVDTACSSSLVALHHACEAIRDGQIGTAIVGGINLLLSPYPFLGFSRASMLSRRGHCFAFDERADGYVRGEGGGVVILKPLAQALADGDRVRAVILGTGVNSDGRTIGLSLPNEAAQSALIRAVCERAGVRPDEFAFFEMHGTGTPAGDPIEAAAVGRALGQGRREPLPIGSVKSNIGHLEPASGMAGLIKAALALERGVMPPSLHCETPNPKIPFGELNLRLLREIEPISDGRCAAVNSFGFGGTNGHAVLGMAPRQPRQSRRRAKRTCRRCVISARSEASLRALAASWRDTLAAATPDALGSLLRGAARRREHLPERLVALGADRDDIVAALADFAAGTESAAIVTGTAVRDAKLAFVFAGNGAQWPGMGRDAYKASAAFRDAVGLADAALRPGAGLVGRRNAGTRRRRGATGARRYRPAAALRGAGRHRHGAARARDRGAGLHRPQRRRDRRRLGRRRAIAGRCRASRRRAQPAAGTYARPWPHGGAGAGRRSGARASRRDRQPARTGRHECEPIGHAVRLGGRDRAAGSRSAPPRRRIPRPRSRFRVSFGGHGSDPRRSARRSRRPDFRRAAQPR